MLSDRSAFVDEEPGRLETALAARRARGEAVIDLTCADVAFAGGEDAIRAALAAPPSDPHLAIARMLEAESDAIDPAQIVLSAGRGDAYSRLLYLLCDPGDEVLVPPSFSPVLERVAHERGVALAPYPLAFDGRWQIDPAAIWDAVGDRTRAIVVASPTEPVGAILRAEALEALEALELPLVIDESRAAYPLEAPAERARSQQATTFTIDGPSAVGDLALAWIAVRGPRAIARDALGRLRRAPSPVASPLARALGALLDREPRAAVLHRATHNLATLRSILTGTRVELPIVEGGWRAALRMPSGEGWPLRALDRGVLASPGSAFDLPGGDRWLVISLLTPPGELARGLELLVELAGGDRSGR